MKIRTICGWCPNAREETQRLAKAGFTVSHGMCNDCKKKMDAQLEERHVKVNDETLLP